MDVRDDTLLELLEGRDTVLTLTTPVLVKALVWVHDLTGASSQLLVLLVTIGHLKVMRIDDLSGELGHEHRAHVLEEISRHSNHLGNGLWADKFLLRGG